MTDYINNILNKNLKPFVRNQVDIASLYKDGKLNVSRLDIEPRVINNILLDRGAPIVIDKYQVQDYQVGVDPFKQKISTHLGRLDITLKPDIANSKWMDIDPYGKNHINHDPKMLYHPVAPAPTLADELHLRPEFINHKYDLDKLFDRTVPTAVRKAQRTNNYRPTPSSVPVVPEVSTLNQTQKILHAANHNAQYVEAPAYANKPYHLQPSSPAPTITTGVPMSEGDLRSQNYYQLATLTAYNNSNRRMLSPPFSPHHNGSMMSNESNLSTSPYRIQQTPNVTAAPCVVHNVTMPSNAVDHVQVLHGNHLKKDYCQVHNRVTSPTPQVYQNSTCQVHQTPRSPNPDEMFAIAPHNTIIRHASRPAPVSHHAPPQKLPEYLPVHDAFTNRQEGMIHHSNFDTLIPKVMHPAQAGHSTAPCVSHQYGVAIPHFLKNINGELKQTVSSVVFASENQLASKPYLPEVPKELFEKRIILPPVDNFEGQMLRLANGAVIPMDDLMVDQDDCEVHFNMESSAYEIRKVDNSKGKFILNKNEQVDGKVLDESKVILNLNRQQQVEETDDHKTYIVRQPLHRRDEELPPLTFTSSDAKVQHHP